MFIYKYNVLLITKILSYYSNLYYFFNEVTVKLNSYLSIKEMNVGMLKTLRERRKVQEVQ